MSSEFSNAPSPGDMIEAAKELTHELQRVNALVEHLRECLLSEAQRIADAERVQRHALRCEYVKPNGRRCKQQKKEGHEEFCRIHAARLYVPERRGPG